MNTVEFIEDVLGTKLFDFQKKMVEDMIEHPEKDIHFVQVRRGRMIPSLELMRLYNTIREAKEKEKSKIEE